MSNQALSNFFHLCMRSGRAYWNFAASEYLNESDKRDVLQAGAARTAMSQANKDALVKQAGLPGFPSFSKVTFEDINFSDASDFSHLVFENVDFIRCTFPNDSLFRYALIFGDLKFCQCTFEKSVSFEGAKFSKDTKFLRTRFRGYVIFDDANFKGSFSLIASRIYSASSFRNSHFVSLGSFAFSRFSELADFTSAQFHGDADFKGARFLHDEIGANFTRAQFIKNTFFTRTRFLSWVGFEGATFSGAGLHSFDRAEFSGFCLFTQVEFVGVIRFSEVLFKQSANFSRSHFHSFTNFQRSIFVSDVIFNGTTFRARTNFGSVSFGGPASFLDVKFESSTSFARVAFSEAPKFHGAKFHPDVTFFRSISKYNDVPARSSYRHPSDIWDDRARSWRALKLEMNAFHAHDDEHEFFTRELIARAHADSRAYQILIRLYQGVSDFGRSIRRPSLALAAIYLISLICNVALSSSSGAWAASFDRMTTMYKTMAFTAVSTVPFLGQSRMASDLASGLFGSANVPFVYVVSIIQGLLSAACIFLLGLALRNRFKIK